MLDFLPEIGILLLVYFLDNPFISLGIFLILLITTISYRAIFSIIEHTFTFADFKRLNLKQRSEYIIARIISYILNPINIIFIALLTYILNKKFGDFYIWIENPWLLFFYLYCCILIIVTIIEIIVNIYVYKK